MITSKPISFEVYKFSAIIEFDPNFEGGKFPIELGKDVYATCHQEAREDFDEMGLWGLDYETSVVIEK